MDLNNAACEGTARMVMADAHFPDFVVEEAIFSGGVLVLNYSLATPLPSLFASLPARGSFCSGSAVSKLLISKPQR